MEEINSILTLSIDIGAALLENGAEIFRVYDSVVYILEAYGVRNHNVFVISNGIFASAGEGTDDACSVIRHVPLGSIHLGRIVALNQLSRDLRANPCDIQEARRRLEECKKSPSYPAWVQYIGCGVGCGGIIYMLGSTIFDGFVGFFIGFFLRWFSLKGAKYKISPIVVNMAGSFLITILAYCLTVVRPASSLDYLVISGIFAMIPGTMFTTAIRDLFNADYLSGWIHLVDALLAAVELAAGVGIALKLCAYIFSDGQVLL